MKKFIFFLLTLGTVTALTAQDLNTIEFKNKTKNEIYYLFFSPGDSEYWGPDVLGDTRTLTAGETVEFFISYPDPINTFDFMAIDDEGNVYEFYDMEISDEEPARIVINSSYVTDQVDLDSLEEDLVALEIQNVTGFELYYMFISPYDSNMYGIDFMDSETTLMDGDSVSVLIFQSNAEIAYDIMAIDDEGDSYSFQLSLDPDMESQYTEITLDDID